MKVLIIGSTGMLGQALIKEATYRGIESIGSSRTGSQTTIEITNDIDIQEKIEYVRPDVIINTAAITNLSLCEKKPDYAYLVNGRAVSIIAKQAEKLGAYFIQISTDHYYTGDKNLLHNESSPISLLNEYARTKYVGELFALTYQNSLVVRTNIVGFRDRPDQPTFVEEIIKKFQDEREHLTLFDDFYTSSIDVAHFSTALFDLIPKKITGTINLASKEVSTKKQFISALAEQLGFSLTNRTSIGSVTSLCNVVRAESLGLEVSKTEKVLGRSLPNLTQVVESLASEYRRRY
ncbi:SDR family oxidoreductase [Aneurinibacillus uraniidurans]|uniref:SDR family oxidoreductase n=1 Tax=Aneurinibacillus uraniidurans TaxID=2966586 RepID=UPI0023497E0E|nr:sugar nucleotide-binding protein [Aneurinibacillus sp. B1]WCN38145.1 sugar nucleotide-binding protein [Aneurinibacillus sp. B1]